MLGTDALRHVLDQSSQVVLFFSTSGKLVDANMSAKQLFRGRSAKIIGKTFGDFFSESDRESVGLRLQQVIRTEEPCAFDTEMVDGSGKSRRGRLQLFVVEGMRSRLVVALLSDDTLISHSAAETEQIRKQLIVSMRLLSVAESYLMLMHSIHPHAQSIEQQGRKLRELSSIFGEPGQTLLRTELATLDKATVAVMRALRTGQSITRREESPHQSLAVQNLLEELNDFCKDRCESRGIDLDILLPAEFTAIEANGAALLQALINIVGNAFDAVVNERMKWIRVEARAIEAAVEFIVADSGAGIPETYRNRLGEPFFSTKAMGQGSGLGLYFAKRIAEDHKGRLQCTRYHGPTTFTLTVPKSAAPKSPAPTAKPRDAAPDVKSDRVPRNSNRARTNR